MEKEVLLESIGYGFAVTLYRASVTGHMAVDYIIPYKGLKPCFQKN